MTFSAALKVNPSAVHFFKMALSYICSNGTTIFYAAVAFSAQCGFSDSAFGITKWRPANAFELEYEAALEQNTQEHTPE